MGNCRSYHRYRRIHTRGDRRDSRKIRLWDLASESLIEEIDAHRHGVTALTYCQLPDGPAIASLGYDHLIRVWDVRSGSELAVLPGYTEWNGALHFVTSGGRRS